MGRRRSFGRVFKRGASWYMRFHFKARPVERVGGPSRDLAERKLARVQLLIADGASLEQILHEVFDVPLRTTNALTLRDSIKPYLDDSVGRRKASTITGYRSIFDAAAEQPWGALDLRAIDHRQIKDWIAERHKDKGSKRGAAGSTLNRSLCALSSLFRWAIREGYAEANPIARIPKYSEKGRERETYLTEHEARELVDCAPLDFRPLLICALATGLRKGEIQKLTWGSVDLARRFLTVEPENAKTSRARTVPLSGWLEEALSKLTPAEGADRASTLVFRTAAGGAFTNWEIRKRLDVAIEDCEAIAKEKKEKVTMHVMRHTAASLMVAAGVPIFDVAKILGHSTIAVTMKYAHFAPQAGRGAIDALDRLLRPPKPSADHVAEQRQEYRPTDAVRLRLLPHDRQQGTPSGQISGQAPLGRRARST